MRNSKAGFLASLIGGLILAAIFVLGVTAF
jgi:hypothetical protein